MNAPDASRAKRSPFDRFTRVRQNLKNYVWSANGVRSTAGAVGASASNLILPDSRKRWPGAVLDTGHFGVNLTAQERRMLTLWVDLSSPFYGSELDPAGQLLGAAASMPFDFVPWNPTGAETGIYPADNTPPSAVSTVSASSPSVYPFVINLAWTPSIDNESGVGCYAVYRDGVFYQWTSSPSFSDYSIQPGESHTYAVTSVNRCGVQSQKSTAVPVSSYIDQTPPTAPGGLIATPQGTALKYSVALTWQKSTDPESGVKGYRIRRNDTLLPLGTGHN